MAVITSRQPGLRPETIRTRLARFMPSRSSTGWSVAWSSHNEHADEVSDEHELQTAEHLGCYGSAVAHALAQAELTPQRLRLSADSSAAEDGSRVITIEVRAKITGPAVDQDLFDAIIRRAEPSCPVLRGLASEVTIRLIAILDDSLGAAADPSDAKPTSMPRQAGGAAMAQPGKQTSAAPAAAAAPMQAAQAGADDARAAKSAASGSALPGAPGVGAQMQMMTGAARMLGVMRGTSSASSSSSLVSTASTASAGRSAAPATAMQATPMKSGRLPSWLSTRMMVLLVVAFGLLAAVPVMWSSPA